MRIIAILISLIIGLSSPVIVFADETKSAADLKQVQPSKTQISDQSKIAETHIKSIAASCAACHGTNGNSVSKNSLVTTLSISNINKSTFVAKMLAFRSGERPATVMHRHAKGLTVQEIDGLAEYFSKQPSLQVRAISSQKLSETYPN